MEMTTIDQQRERLQQQLADLEQQEREAEAVRAVREEQAQARKAEAVAAHEQAEKEHAGDLTAMTKTLTDARKALASKMDAAVSALLQLWDQATAYGQLLDEASDSLREVGLVARHDDGDICVRFDVGGHKRSGFGGPRLLLAGQEWHPVSSRQALGYVVELATSGRVPGMQTPNWQPVTGVLGDLVKKPKPIPALPQHRPQTVSARDLYGPSVA